jgi:hypothetical protein
LLNLRCSERNVMILTTQILLRNVTRYRDEIPPPPPRRVSLYYITIIQHKIQEGQPVNGWFVPWRRSVGPFGKGYLKSFRPHFLPFSGGTSRGNTRIIRPIYITRRTRNIYIRTRIRINQLHHRGYYVYVSYAHRSTRRDVRVIILHTYTVVSNPWSRTRDITYSTRACLRNVSCAFVLQFKSRLRRCSTAEIVIINLS